MLSSLLSFQITEWLGTAATYLIAGAIAAAGVYLYGFASAERAIPLIGPLRNVGLGMIVAAVVLACAAYFKHVGAAACEDAWRSKNLETQIADLKTENAAWQRAADVNAEQLRELARSREGADRELAAYRQQIKALAPDVARARLATPDDRRRLCAIVGNRAPGCPPADDLRSSRGRLSGDRRD